MVVEAKPSAPYRLSLPLSLLWMLAPLWFALFVPVAHAQPTADIQSVRFSTTQNRLTLLSSERLSPQIRYLDEVNNPRIVIDLPDAVFQPVRQEINSRAGGIDRIRISQFSSSPPAVRMVLELQAPLDISIRSERMRQGYQTEIVPEARNMNTQLQPQKVSAAETVQTYELQKLTIENNNLKLVGTGPIYPQIRKSAQDSSQYTLTLDNFTTDLNGRQNLSSPFLKDVRVRREGRKTEILFSVTNPDIEIVPYSDGNTCLIQFLVVANSRNQVQIQDIEVTDLSPGLSRIRIHSDKPFDYQMYPLESPHRLVVDTLGTMLLRPQSERSILSSTLQRIRFIPVSQDKNSDLRIVFDLKEEATYQYNAAPDGRFLEITVQLKKRSNVSEDEDRPPPAILGNQRAFIVVDAGHGGNDPGAIGLKGTREKDVTLAVSEYLKRYLENDNLQVVMTRAEDLEILLQPRVDAANLRNADIFVSVHCNSMPPGNTHVRGIETYYTTPQSLGLANTLHQYLVKELKATDRRVRQRGLFVTRKANMPSVLLEIGFLSNPDEEALLSSPHYQRQVAKAIRDGIYDYLSKNPSKIKTRKM
jgi:N-acetylmuramoyl-L-alanine amidase CwlD